MTSWQQWQANRRNAQKSTGPVTPEGKQRSRCNAVRHGLAAETVIGTLEDADDYRAFEASVTADYDATSAVERELVLRLASLLWRLRRATAIETSLFEIPTDRLAARQAGSVERTPGSVVAALRCRDQALDSDTHSDKSENGPIAQADGVVAAAVGRLTGNTGTLIEPIGSDSGCFAAELTRRYLRLSDLPNFVLDRLSRYEMTLWRQVGQILFTLDNLDRRKSQERRRIFPRRTTALDIEGG